VKVFLLKPADRWYDEYEGFVAVAESEEDALKMVMDNYSIFKHQLPITIDEVNLHEAGIILEAFNAG
jgi:hypothetical protein